MDDFDNFRYVGRHRQPSLELFSSLYKNNYGNGYSSFGLIFWIISVISSSILRFSMEHISNSIIGLFKEQVNWQGVFEENKCGS
jgi:hypothetical protein